MIDEGGSSEVSSKGFKRGDGERARETKRWEEGEKMRKFRDTRKARNG